MGDMLLSKSHLQAASTGASAFITTHWSAVLRAGHEAGSDSDAALETLCQNYWYPLYAYIRRCGHGPHDAQDLTQAYFAYLLNQRLLTKADPDAGRFRSFLLGSLKKFMANNWRTQNAEKRRPERLISLDALDAEARYAFEPMEEQTPQTLFEQTWAIAVLEQAARLLEAEYAGAGKQTLFDLLAPALQGDRLTASYLELGGRLGLSEGAVKVAVHRLRQRYREQLRCAVANTVADALEVDEELRCLTQALSR